ncbi:MAG: hypothetical protein H6811_03585 [Phycisphaeraceae bacterium]|nr:hypothetical protein [Phycisphaeraceae bacterium]
MKNVMEWVKKNLLIVICLAVIIISLPASWLISGRWNGAVRKSAQKKVDAELKKVSNQNVTYQLPSLAPGVERVELSAPPNPKLTQWFDQRIAEQNAEAQAVAADALAFNRRDHRPLVDSLFPSPPDAVAERLQPIEFVRALIGHRARPGVAQQMLDLINAGQPPAPSRVLAKLQDDRARFIADLERQRGPSPNLSAEETRQIADRLAQSRIEEYQRQSRRFSVYCGPEVINAAIGAPAAEPASALPLETLFQMQWATWIVEDLLAAVRTANSDERARLQRVEDGAVKRIEEISIDWPVSVPIYGDNSVASRPGQGTQDGVVGTSDSWSLTGRVSNPDNQVYDAISARMTLIVDSERLPQLIDALARTNFMSVLDVDLEEVDVWKELQRGYVFGASSVVRARIEIETIWLRQWTAPLMPEVWRTGLGAQLPEPRGSDEG